ncbi:MAG: hypothetical protein H8D47_04525 [Planctomycetes bacterium]|nr:hypothetical protein [Planctomycetota bacterium]MBL7106647.1 hypothetical protein [Phycisphaerae bacterium]
MIFGAFVPNTIGFDNPKYRGVAWYARTVTIPKTWNAKHIGLVLGAVDWEAKVWINGVEAGSRIGGYTPFAVDITKYAKSGEEAFIVVRVEDFVSNEQPKGKQSGWYTGTSGIWQTAYLEGRGNAYLDRFELIADLENHNKQANVKVNAYIGGNKKDISCQITIGSEKAELKNTGKNGFFSGTVIIDNPKLWSPSEPELYDIVVCIKQNGKVIDKVQSYTGLREISSAKAPGKDYKHICLNGKPIYLLGALQQFFHPDGIYQYPNDQVIRHDYAYAKKIGLNFLRIHIKSEIPRALYWADKLGVMIMQDLPNFESCNEISQKNYEIVLRNTIARDFIHPLFHGAILMKTGVSWAKATTVATGSCGFATCTA